MSLDTARERILNPPPSTPSAQSQPDAKQSRTGPLRAATTPIGAVIDPAPSASAAAGHLSPREPKPDAKVLKLFFFSTFVWLTCLMLAECPG
jgi:hypothetical protein